MFNLQMIDFDLIYPSVDKDSSWFITHVASGIVFFYGLNQHRSSQYSRDLRDRSELLQLVPLKYLLQGLFSVISSLVTNELLRDKLWLEMLMRIKKKNWRLMVSIT